jgi:hypothetical protein
LIEKQIIFLQLCEASVQGVVEEDVAPILPLILPSSLKFFEGREGTP